MGKLEHGKIRNQRSMEGSPAETFKAARTIHGSVTYILYDTTYDRYVRFDRT